MLTQLLIDNYALIDRSLTEFKEGFTVITGETGAGKSIMLDALGLLMGARADSKVSGDKERKIVIEAVFSNPDKAIEEICRENGIEWEENEIILRREISKTGKSRGFINDTPVNLTLLTLVSQNLIDIHSQHSNTLLNKPLQQLNIIDSYEAIAPLHEEYKTVFHEYVALRNKIKSIREEIARSKENKEFLMFRLEQLDKVKPKKGELKALEKEYELLGDADRIKSDLTDAYDLIGGDYSTSALKLINNAAAVIDSIDFELFDAEGSDNIAERLNSIRIELKDISDTLEGYADSIDADPERLEKVKKRIDILTELMKRLKVKDETELIELHQRLRDEALNLGGSDTQVADLENRLKEMAKDLKSRADILSEARVKASEKFSALIEEKIRPLGMPNVKFAVNIEKGKMSPDGQDIINFYCSFNKNHPLQKISDIASGGEIARVMLGIKSVMAEKMNLPTIIFDEIDTGVSGEIAHKMGEMMKAMSKDIQTIAVTHLPQVAANGDIHMKVYKDDDKEKTISHIKVLDKDERILEIAGMLSGSEINDVALENAKILLKNN